MANEILWSTDLYRQIRRRFEVLDDCVHQFQTELQLHNGEVAEARQKPPSIREVVDMLGMNDRFKIVFYDEQLYMMFLLKWS